MSLRLSEFREANLLDKILFGVLSPHEIRQLAKVTVVRGDLYEADGTPVSGGLRDPHFGAIEPGERCPVCGNSREECPGHFGKIELARPVLIPHYTDYVYKILQATCRVCGRITLPEEKIKYYRLIFRRLRGKWPQLAKTFATMVVKEAAQATQCPHCGKPQYKVVYIRPFHFYEKKPEGDVKLTPSEIRERLEKTGSEIEILGVHPERSRPEWMVATVLIVPPLAVRPSITLETGLRSEDDLTHALAEIVRQNEKLRNVIVTNAPETLIEENWMVLQEMVAAYIDNELPGARRLTHRRKRYLKTLAQRLKGKDGRIRGNLSGKRVNYSARTVISPDPYISINEVGVPEEIAKTLTIAMRVTPYNLEEARRFVLNGPDKWPGALFVYKTSERKKYDLRFFKDYKKLAESLEPGDIVERHLINGDIVLFNRQPSLHRMSIMGHIVRVMPGKTFRLNLLVCPPYNADFDGDEMNLHVPRLEEAQAEAREIMLVEKHILTPRYGGPIIGGRQDYVSGAYLLTVKTRLFTKEEVERLLSVAGYKGDLPEPAILKPRPLWTGKQLASIFLPDDLNFKGKSKTNAGDLACADELCLHDSYIVITNGKLLEGVLDKKAIGAEEPNNLLHIIALEYGNSKARQLLDSFYRMFIRMLELRGLTISLHDIDLPERAKQEIEELIREYKGRVYSIIEDYRKGTLEPIPGRSLEESLEIKIMEVLDELRKKVQEVASNNLDPFNDVFVMARTGARGSDVNISQMAAMLGQQAVRGKRIRRGFRNRVLAHFRENDTEPEAWGFVRSSFRKGLRPTEVFFHAAAGREGLVDTAVKTSQSGYMQRRLINALQDIVVTYDGTVRDLYGNLIQLKYGEDGVDPMKTYHGKPVDVKRIVQRVKTGKANTA
ncbi:DNA-directed RNA polymerase subunit A' [Aeropyrum camini]|uniref:DNA-directed RNA polymerase subunit Rpo1N n=1 Tax=Aeropyrum camini SY1 = JCM 12091 TaxID=1198449 RepID=U3TF91_9CREN|nr:DNA-directed RNA polymerase subunit A' [Aeropyrum camini]BAN90633.1 DNA-directed RNA polymerase subunit A' [Aeropyrum camini SY1 = JCM 12091]